jgi:molybdopterin synthase catalytic subunit
MSLDELRAALEACQRIMTRVKARHPALPDEILQAIERTCDEYRAELDRRAV